VKLKKQDGGDGPKVKTNGGGFGVEYEMLPPLGLVDDIKKVVCFGFRLVEVGILSGCSILLKRMCAAFRIGLSWFLKIR